MTSQSSSINNSPTDRSVEKRSNPCGFGALLADILRRHWTTGLLISIIMFFTFPVFVIAGISVVTGDYMNHQRTRTLVEALRQDMIDWAEIMRWVMIPALSVLAIVMVCIMLKYLHNRVAVDFYHSLPIKREKLLGVNLLAGYLLLLVPYIVMVAVAALVIAVNGAFSVELLSGIGLMLAESVVYSLIFYALTALVGVVSGLTSVQLLLTAIAIFIIPALYVTVIWFIDMYSPNMWAGWYTSEQITSLLSPVIDFFWDFEDKLAAHHYISYILATGAIFALTIVVYRKYKSERAGQSVIFPIVGSVVKYAVMLLATLLLGMFFYLIMDNYAWMIFGMICGAVLTFMLSNTIINKSAKAMFLGIKGLAVFMVSVAVVTTVFMTNLFGINTNPPMLISKVEVTFDSLTNPITFRDKAVIDAILKIYEEGELESENTVTVWEYDDQYRYYSNDQLSLGVVFYPTVGIPNAKYFTISNTSDFADELRVILDSGEFKAGYIDTVEAIVDGFYEDYIWNYNGLSVSFKDGKAQHVNDVYETNKNVPITFEALKSALLADAQSIGYDSFQSQALGYFTLFTGESGNNYVSTRADYVDYNLMLGMDATYELVAKNGRMNVPSDELLDNYARSVENLKVFDNNTGKSREYTKPDEIREIIGSIESLALDHWNRCELTLKDRNYTVVYDFKYEDGEQSSMNQRASAFLYERVPAFVSADLPIE